MAERRSGNENEKLRKLARRKADIRRRQTERAVFEKTVTQKRGTAAVQKEIRTAQQKVADADARVRKAEARVNRILRDNPELRLDKAANIQVKVVSEELTKSKPGLFRRLAKKIFGEGRRGRGGGGAITGFPEARPGRVKLGKKGPGEILE